MMYVFRGNIFARGFSELMSAFINLNAAATDSIRGMTTWRAELEIRGTKIPLFTIEDDEDAWPEPSCKHCRVANCDTTLFSAKRFHVIIPLQEQWNDPLNETTLDHPEGNSLLYAVIHSNAFSHVLWVQRSSTGLMSGSDFMDLWECIVKNLQISDVTLEDMSTKDGVELPLLYGLAIEKSWFSRWGYQAWKGSYGSDQLKYHAALTHLRNLEIIKAANLFIEGDRIALITILRRYQDLSHDPIQNLCQLLHFILTYRAKRRLFTESVSMASIPRKSWTRRQVNSVLSVLLRVLTTHGRNPASKEELLHEATSINISRELSEHVISSVKNLKYGESRIVVCRDDVEYHLEKIPLQTTEVLHVYQDAAMVYEIIIRRYSETRREYKKIRRSTNVVRNCKYLIKGAPPKSREDPLKVHCKCGAREDDGETLVQCNMCESYHHLICNELQGEGVFICSCCLLEEEEKWMVAEAVKKSKRELEDVKDAEMYQ